jgi:DNA-binding transcriptional ArsR family regulator
MAKDILAEILSSRVRAAVLTFFVARSDDAFSLTELARALSLPVSSLQHECYKLERLGVLRGRREGGSRRYRLQREAPLTEPLARLVIAARGTAGLLAAALVDVPGLERAFLVQREGTGAALVGIGDVPLDQLDAAQTRVAALLGRPPDEIGLAFYQPDDWRRRQAEGNPQVRRLLAAPRQDVIDRSGGKR